LGRRILNKKMLNFQELSQPKVFGLDLSNDIIRVAQLPDKFAFGANIKEAVTKANIKTKYVHACLPEQECFIRVAPKDGNIKKEVESNIPLSLKEIYYDTQETRQGLLIVAAKRKIVDQTIDLLNKAGLIAKSLEPESIALARALVKTPDSLLIIKFGKTKINFVICQNNIVYFSATQEKNHILQQLQDYIDFYQTKNGQITKIVLCGEKIPDQQFLEKLKIPIEIAQNPDYTTAIGLALKQ